MKTKRVFFLLLLFVLIGSTVVHAAPAGSLGAGLPWKSEMFNNDTPEVQNLSTAFVGLHQTPMMSWGETGQDIIFRAFKPANGTGDCGPNNSWRCQSAGAAGLEDGTISNLVAHQFVQSHLISWMYRSGNKLRGLKIEQMADMSYVTSSSQDLVELDNFGGTLVGAPSLAIVGGNYRAAFTVREAGGGDFSRHSVVYMHYVGGTSDTTCLDAGSAYRCDVIDLNMVANSIGPASLSIADDGSVGIAYRYGNTVKYAREHTFGINLNPCPIGNSWRCTTVVNPGSGTIGFSVKLASGSTSSKRAIVYSFNPGSGYRILSAFYVGTGGSCAAASWDCGGVDAAVADITKTTYSVAFDENDFPVIAWNNQMADDAAQRLYVTYPAARLDPTGMGWIRETIDGNNWSETGSQNAISISDAGMGFIAYMQPRFRACGELLCLIDTSPNLKAAFQRYTTFIPSVSRD